jgi:diadenosine tetraphosphate (Ap4A) HIT family hydrolase
VTSCSICKDSASSDEGGDAWFGARLQTGYVRLSPNQYFPGASFCVSRQCVREVFDPDRTVRELRLQEMAEVAAAVSEAFQPRKLNIESLGNGVPNPYWWLTPRYETNARSHAPIWEDLEFLRTQWTEGGRLSVEGVAARKALLLAALKSRGVMIDLMA